MSKRTRLLNKLKHVYSHNAKLVLDVENKDIELIIEGLEKQIAKKVKYRQGVLYEYCPTCNFAHLYSNSKYCHQCGQKVEIEME